MQKQGKQPIKRQQNSLERYLKRRKLQELLSTKITTGSVDLNIKKRKVERNEKH